MNTKYNQLRLGTRDHLHEYSDNEDFYRMVLNAWRGEYPDGHIDYMRFMMDWSRLSGEELYEMADKMYEIYDAIPNTVDKSIVIVDWENPEEARPILSDLMRNLINCINPKAYFKARNFDKAFKRYFEKNMHRKRKVKKAQEAAEECEQTLSLMARIGQMIRSVFI